MAIHTRVQIMSLQNIDTSKQSFDCKFWIKFKWDVDTPYAALHTSRIDVPKPSMPDCIGELFVATKVEKFPIEEQPYKCLVTARYILRGVFPHVFQLTRFPFDEQMLQLRLVFYGHPPLLASFQQHPQCNIFHESIVQQDAWCVEDCVHMTEALTPAERNEHGQQHKMLVLGIHLTRKPAFYMWNVYCPILLLCGLSFLSFGQDAEDATGRLSTVLTLLLTMVALKLTTTQYLPVVAQLTHMDRFILIHMGILTTSCVLHVAFICNSEGDSQKINLVCMSSLLFVWLCCLVYMRFV